MRYGALGRRYGRMQRVVGSTMYATQEGKYAAHAHVCQLSCGHSKTLTRIPRLRRGQDPNNVTTELPPTVLRCDVCG